MRKNLPVDSDLSMNSLHWAISLLGYEEAGKPLRLFVAPQSLHYAWHICYLVFGEKWSKHITVHVAATFAEHAWEVQKGEDAIVSSGG